MEAPSRATFRFGERSAIRIPPKRSEPETSYSSEQSIQNEQGELSALVSKHTPFTVTDKTNKQEFFLYALDLIGQDSGTGPQTLSDMLSCLQNFIAEKDNEGLHNAVYDMVADFMNVYYPWAKTKSNYTWFLDTLYWVFVFAFCPRDLSNVYSSCIPIIPCERTLFQEGDRSMKRSVRDQIYSRLSDSSMQPQKRSKILALYLARDMTPFEKDLYERLSLRLDAVSDPVQSGIPYLPIEKDYGEFLTVQHNIDPEKWFITSRRQNGNNFSFVYHQGKLEHLVSLLANRSDMDTSFPQSKTADQMRQLMATPPTQIIAAFDQFLYSFMLGIIDEETGALVSNIYDIPWTLDSFQQYPWYKNFYSSVKSFKSTQEKYADPSTRADDEGDSMFASFIDLEKDRPVIRIVYPVDETDGTSNNVWKPTLVACSYFNAEQNETADGFVNYDDKGNVDLSPKVNRIALGFESDDKVAIYVYDQYLNHKWDFVLSPGKNQETMKIQSLFFSYDASCLGIRGMQGSSIILSTVRLEPNTEKVSKSLLSIRPEPAWNMSIDLSVQTYELGLSGEILAETFCPCGTMVAVLVRSEQEKLCKLYKLYLEKDDAEHEVWDVEGSENMVSARMVYEKGKDLVITTPNTKFRVNSDIKSLEHIQDIDARDLDTYVSAPGFNICAGFRDNDLIIYNNDVQDNVSGRYEVVDNNSYDFAPPLAMTPDGRCLIVKVIETDASDQSTREYFFYMHINKYFSTL